MNTIETNHIIKQITTKLINNLKIEQIIVFGSSAVGVQTDESDIDLIVILDENGWSKSYEEKIKRRSKVTRLLSEIRKKIPLDVLVYTKAEWKKFLDKDSSFIREIKNSGVNLI